jgi:uncharacterized protein YndB with AHSA1/START domain
MATISISPDQDTVLAEIHIAAPPERVFQAITDPRQMLLWWGQKEKKCIAPRNSKPTCASTANG